LAVTKKTVGDGEKLLTYLNSPLKVLSGLDIFPRGTKKKLNFVDQCNLKHSFVNVSFFMLQIAVQHNYLLNKFTSVQATCFGSYRRAIIRPYTISTPESEEVLQLMIPSAIALKSRSALKG
jgi:hypothetical protein